jgi:hypothetical protein
MGPKPTRGTRLSEPSSTCTNTLNWSSLPLSVAPSVIVHMTSPRDSSALFANRRSQVTPAHGLCGSAGHWVLPIRYGTDWTKGSRKSARIRLHDLADASGTKSNLRRAIRLKLRLHQGELSQVLRSELRPESCSSKTFSTAMRKIRLSSIDS